MQRRVLSPFSLLVLCTALVLCPSANAQTGLYGAFTGVRPNSNADWLYGPTVGLYSDRHNFVPFHFGVDFRGSALYGGVNGSSGHKNSFINGLGGFRASVVPHVIPFKVYGEALGGVGVLDIGTAHFTRFQYQVNAGLEYTFFPRVDWRIAEGSWSGFVGTANNYDHPVGLSTGIVLRLP